MLSQDRVLTIALVQQLLKTIQDKPEIVSLIGRLVRKQSCRRAAKARALTAPRRLSGRCLEWRRGYTGAGRTFNQKVMCATVGVTWPISS